MFKLIKGARVFSPDDLGVKDLLIVRDTILAIKEKIPAEEIPWNMEI